MNIVSPHRIREELILILNEPKPYRYIKRLNKLIGFSFIHKRIKLSKKSFQFFLRAQKTILRYQIKFKKHRDVQEWLVYMAGIIINLSLISLKEFFDSFGLKKGERIILESIHKDYKKIKRIDRKMKAAGIHKVLDQYSFESLLFFHAYYPKRILRANIEYFLDDLVGIRLKTMGRDLKKMGFKPHNLYGKLLKKLLIAKVDKNLVSKKEEIQELKRIFKKISAKKY